MATHDQYVDLLAENERLRDRLRAATTRPSSPTRSTT